MFFLGVFTGDLNKSRSLHLRIGGGKSQISPPGGKSLTPHHALFLQTVSCTEAIHLRLYGDLSPYDTNLSWLAALAFFATLGTPTHIDTHAHTFTHTYPHTLTHTHTHTKVAPAREKILAKKEKRKEERQEVTEDLTNSRSCSLSCTLFLYSFFKSPALNGRLRIHPRICSLADVVFSGGKKIKL